MEFSELLQEKLMYLCFFLSGIPLILFYRSSLSKANSWGSNLWSYVLCLPHNSNRCQFPSIPRSGIHTVHWLPNCFHKFVCQCKVERIKGVVAPRVLRMFSNQMFIEPTCPKKIVNLFQCFLVLVISNRIVADRHGGEIEFESQPGETHFKVRLPFNHKQSSKWR